MARPLKNRDTSHGFTLLEVLASVVVLSLFVTALLTFADQLMTQTAVNEQRQKATFEARKTFADIAATGAANFFTSNPSPYSKDDGPYHITATEKNTTNPANWAYGMIDVEVTVVWQSSVSGISGKQSVTVEQAFLK